MVYFKMVKFMVCELYLNKFFKRRGEVDLWWKGRVSPRQPSGVGVGSGGSGRRWGDQGKNTTISVSLPPLVDYGSPLAKPHRKPVGE